MFLLFEYGQLQSPDAPQDAWAQGQLRKRGDDVAAQFGDEYSTKVFGQLKTIEPDRLERLDNFERPEYARITILVRYKGNWLWAYAYIYDEPAFFDLPLIESGSFLP